MIVFLKWDKFYGEQGKRTAKDSRAGGYPHIRENPILHSLTSKMFFFFFFATILLFDENWSYEVYPQKCFIFLIGSWVFSNLLIEMFSLQVFKQSSIVFSIAYLRKVETFWKLANLLQGYDCIGFQIKDAQATSHTQDHKHPCWTDCIGNHTPADQPCSLSFILAISIQRCNTNLQRKHQKEESQVPLTVVLPKLGFASVARVYHSL